MYICTDLRTQLEVNLAAIIRNAHAIKKHTGKELIAVVKANAYGHGALPVAEYLKYTADMFAVATVEEAIELREARIKKPIFILFSPHPLYAESIVDNHFITAVDNWRVIEDLRFWRRAFDIIKQHPSRIVVHVDINTGMNRSGVHFSEAEGFLNKLKYKPEIQIHGVFTHLATAEESDKRFSYLQLERFSSIFDALPKDVVKPRGK